MNFWVPEYELSLRIKKPGGQSQGPYTFTDFLPAEALPGFYCKDQRKFSLAFGKRTGRKKKRKVKQTKTQGKLEK